MKSEYLEIVIIRGAPGIGKSSLAKLLSKWLVNSVIIEIDHLRGMISNVEWSNSEQHLLSLKNAQSLVKNFLEAGYHPIIIVDTFSRGKLTQFVQKLRRYRYHVFSLYAESEDILKRIENRESGYKEVKSCLILNEEVFKNRYPNETFFDTSYKKKEEVYEIIKNFIINLKSEKNGN